jgi:hypothetical protein
MAALAFHWFSKTIDIPAGLRRQPLEAWQTSARLNGLLRRSGIRVLGDLHGRKVRDFASAKNCGAKTLHELDSLVHGAESGAPTNGNVPVFQNGAGFAIPESVCQLQFHELPITKRLANVVRSIGARTLGDLKGRGTFELLQYKQCGWRTLGEIQHLIERAISGDFDESHTDDTTAAAELLTLLEQGIGKLKAREEELLLARIGGEDLPCPSLAEIGRQSALTRSRVQQLVPRAVDHLRKTWGPRVPRLLEVVKRRCMSMVCPLTPALLERWIGDCSKRFRLSRKAQVRLIAALDETIPCWPEKHDRAGSMDNATRKVDRYLASLAREAGGHIMVAEAYRHLTRQLPDYRRLTIKDFLRMLRRVRRTVVEFNDPQLPIICLRTSNAVSLPTEVRTKALKHLDQPEFVYLRFRRSVQRAASVNAG